MWTRRDTLKAMAALGGAYVLPPPVRHAIGATQPDVEIRLIAARGRARIWKGAPTDVLQFTGEVLRGREGVVDAGFKDTFLIFPGERVRVHVVPTEPGLFMYHCHNLEHEDAGMMRNCSFDT